MHVKEERSDGRGGGKEQRVPRAEPETNREPLRRRRPVTQAATSSAERKTWRGSPARGGAAHPDIRTEARGTRVPRTRLPCVAPGPWRHPARAPLPRLHRARCLLFSRSEQSRRGKERTVQACRAPCEEMRCKHRVPPQTATETRTGPGGAPPDSLLPPPQHPWHRGDRGPRGKACFPRASAAQETRGSGRPSYTKPLKIPTDVYLAPDSTLLPTG